MRSFAAVKSISAFADVKHIRVAEQLSLLPWYIDFEILFTDLPQVWLRADHPALREEWDLAAFLRYPHITICWEQRDTWALDDVLQELGHKRTWRWTLPGFEQSLLYGRPAQSYHAGHRAALIASTIISSTSYRWFSGPLPLEPRIWKIRVPFTFAMA